MTKTKDPLLGKGLSLIAEAFVKEEERYKELEERFDRLRDHYNTMAEEAIITVDEEKFLLSYLVDCFKLNSSNILEDNVRLGSIIEKLKERENVRRNNHNDS